MKIATTTKAFREGIKLSAAKGDEVRWTSTGHLSVRLLDASGTVPLAGREVRVDVPGEGRLTLTSAQDGLVFHPDVPYQDYVLDLGSSRVQVPAVGERSELHERHVVTQPIGFVHALIYKPNGRELADAEVTLTFASGATATVRTDAGGVIRHQEPAPGQGDVVVEHEFGRAEVPAFASPQKLVRATLESQT